MSLILFLFLNLASSSGHQYLGPQEHVLTLQVCFLYTHR
jgi:hypothetical protein